MTSRFDPIAASEPPWHGVPRPAGGLFDDAPIISAYLRADMLVEGGLVDVSEAAARLGITFPVALTRAAWIDCVEWEADDTAETGAPQDQGTRLHDVLWMFRLAARAEATDRIRFGVYRIPRGKRHPSPELVTLKAVCGPGDNAEPVITIMAEGED